MSSHKWAISCDKNYVLEKVTSVAKLKNKHIYRSRISDKKFREILKYFAENIEDTKIANLTDISRISINKILKSIRVLMLQECEVLKSNEQSEVEFRYNNSRDTKELYQILLKSIRENLLKLF